MKQIAFIFQNNKKCFIKIFINKFQCYRCTEKNVIVGAYFEVWCDICVYHLLVIKCEFKTWYRLYNYQLRILYMSNICINTDKNQYIILI